MDAQDQAQFRESARRDAEQRQQEAVAAGSVPPPCHGANPKLGIGGLIVDCKNKGATEQQLLGRLGMLPQVQ
ncbi:hypothetical protein [Paraburkholderia steynii]|uniref:hypothetical protein n=1 Tax=Paraburkholderia steynii TaxID=1245441 RepID=UPI00141DD4A3|nr:hypothetical protein [Paraburkholderia steynii]